MMKELLVEYTTRLAMRIYKLIKSTEKRSEVEFISQEKEKVGVGFLEILIFTTTYVRIWTKFRLFTEMYKEQSTWGQHVSRKNIE